MDLNALILRSGCSITRLSVGCVLHWGQLLENMPLLEELSTEGTLPCETMHEISRGNICPALRLIACAVAIHDFDIFLDMLESRDTTNETCLFNRIEEVSAQCLDFGVDDGQWERIRALGMRITITDDSSPLVPVIRW